MEVVQNPEHFNYVCMYMSMVCLSVCLSVCPSNMSNLAYQHGRMQPAAAADLRCSAGAEKLVSVRAGGDADTVAIAHARGRWKRHSETWTSSH
jgi:hypothetical protein